MARSVVFHCSFLSLLQATLIPTLLAQEPGFVCVTLDWWPATKCNFGWCPWHNSSIWAIDLEEVKPYAKLLTPFILRVGGSLQDQYTFEPQCSDEEQFLVDEANRFGFGNGCISHERVRAVSDFCHEVGCELVWGLNAMAGRTSEGIGEWDSRNTRELLEFFIKIQAPLHAVTLGNEVWGEMVNLSLEQTLGAFSELGQIVEELWSNDTSRPLIAGLDGYVNRRQVSFLADFLEKVEQNNIHMDILNFHEYPLGRSNDPELIDRVMSHDVSFNALAKKVSDLALPKQQVWITECGGSADSGSTQATGSFASGFWYLDGMAMLQHGGYQHFCRQTLAGGNYGLLDQVSPRRPHPDFWNAVLYQKILGRPLLELTERLSSLVLCQDEEDVAFAKTTQWYAFEAKNPNAAFAFLGLNYHSTARCGLVLGDSPTEITEFTLQPSGHEKEPWKAAGSQLNGNLLADNTTQLEGKSRVGSIAWLEPLTYGFFEVKAHDGFPPFQMPQQASS